VLELEVKVGAIASKLGQG